MGVLVLLLNTPNAIEHIKLDLKPAVLFQLVSYSFLWCANHCQVGGKPPIKFFSKLENTNKVVITQNYRGNVTTKKDEGRLECQA